MWTGTSDRDIRGHLRHVHKVDPKDYDLTQSVADATIIRIQNKLRTMPDGPEREQGRRLHERLVRARYFKRLGACLQQGFSDED